MPLLAIAALVLIAFGIWWLTRKRLKSGPGSEQGEYPMNNDPVRILQRLEDLENMMRRTVGLVDALNKERKSRNQGNDRIEKLLTQINASLRDTRR